MNETTTIVRNPLLFSEKIAFRLLFTKGTIGSFIRKGKSLILSEQYAISDKLSRIKK